MVKGGRYSTCHEYCGRNCKLNLC